VAGPITMTEGMDVADRWMSGLVARNRYRADVWGST
jgi:hypothetical protein